MWKDSSVMGQMKETFSSIPAFVKTFLTRALVLFILWKLLYQLVLYPTRFPDQQLTRATASSTSFLFKHLLGENDIELKDERRNESSRTIVYISGKKVIGIADGCNGLELYVLYIGFLYCVPLGIKKQLLFTAIGIVLIFITNSFRCFGLVWLFRNQYSIADFAHHYIFKMAIYGLVFYLWVLYSKKYFSHGA